jgi:hypothetical protein
MSAACWARSVQGVRRRHLRRWLIFLAPGYTASRPRLWTARTTAQ